MRTFTILSLLALVISVNVWLALIWDATASQVGWQEATRDAFSRPVAYEFTPIAIGDDQSSWRSLDRMGEAGWSVVSCRRAIDDAKDGIYECIMQRPLGKFAITK